ncbi:MAG: hypothetical protein CFE23_10370 [Flavobacterium sp. BFFFF1]|uniref:hypothetical protein n=1 Tax=Flavobacterium sp. BFFFF1 TaxID=2015557 RepID=UPI000BC81E0F|nr:hypothetical protein [Flavobacterium sp. BFFFF1]OYU80297.1 MAG: hypothetical protein CFE23_10370 [Flavobacterium sp. BFFFF1]
MYKFFLLVFAISANTIFAQGTNGALSEGNYQMLKDAVEALKEHTASDNRNHGDSRYTYQTQTGNSQAQGYSNVNPQLAAQNAALAKMQSDAARGPVIVSNQYGVGSAVYYDTARNVYQVQINDGSWMIQGQSPFSAAAAVRNAYDARNNAQAIARTGYIPNGYVVTQSRDGQGMAILPAPYASPYNPAIVIPLP